MRLQIYIIGPGQITQIIFSLELNFLFRLKKSTINKKEKIKLKIECWRGGGGLMNKLDERRIFKD